jgi:dihydroorotate dehydrogenase (fumarate)
MELTSQYLGMTLRSPIIASAGPVTGNPAMWERLEHAGAGAIVLPSLFEEQIESDAFAVDSLLDSGRDIFPEALDFFPELDEVHAGPERFVALVEKARDQLSIPVIASLNGTSSGGWVRYAKHLADAGAHALELNIYDVVIDVEESSSDVEKRYLDLVADVTSEVAVPVAVKLAPWFTSPGHFAKGLVEAGAAGLVLFNRFYQPEIDLETLDVKPRLQLSTSAEVRLPLHWIGILHGRVDCSLAATSGVHGGDDVLRLLLAGADAVCTTSALLVHGPEFIHTLLSVVRTWGEQNEYESIEQLKGSVSMRNVPDPQAYSRANYVQTLHSWSSRLLR